MQVRTPDALYFFEDWAIHPNPDWQFINIFTPNGVTLHEVVIDTVSYVPLPPAANPFQFCAHYASSDWPPSKRPAL